LFYCFSVVKCGNRLATPESEPLQRFKVVKYESRQNAEATLRILIIPYSLSFVNSQVAQIFDCVFVQPVDSWLILR
jgi:hypothetical protein